MCVHVKSIEIKIWPPPCFFEVNGPSEQESDKQKQPNAAPKMTRKEK
jgi:hypothetical protein